jgi:hypothetical protein
VNIDDIDFLIIGATKSATTWLQRALQGDPGVFMPDPELHYFSRELARGDEWYLGHFADAVPGQLIGEKSNSYLSNTTVAALIARSMPRTRLIAQLRSPVERAYSHYCMMYRRGEVGRDVARYLDPRNPQETRLLSSGLYARQLALYYEQFPAEQILVTFYEAIGSGAERQLATVREFLGLAPTPYALSIPRKVKDKTVPMVSPWLKRLLGPVKPLVAPIRQTPIFRALRASLVSEVHYTPLPDDIRSRLVDYYAADVEALGRLIGCDLSGWLEQGAAAPVAAFHGGVTRMDSGFVKSETTVGFT